MGKYVHDQYDALLRKKSGGSRPVIRTLTLKQHADFDKIIEEWKKNNPPFKVDPGEMPTTFTNNKK